MPVTSGYLPLLSKQNRTGAASPTGAPGGGASMDDVIEKSAMRKIYWRLLPFAVLSYLLAYIDRINAQLRGADHARRSQDDRRRLWLCRRHLLLGLFHLRGAEQRRPGKGRCAAVDRPHHDHLGHPRRVDRAIGDRWTGSSFGVVRFFCSASPRPGSSPASCSTSPTGSRPIIMPASSPAFWSALPIAVAVGRAGIDRAARPQRPVRPHRLADHVHRRGRSDRAHRPASPSSC